MLETSWHGRPICILKGVACRCVQLALPDQSTGMTSMDFSMSGEFGSNDHRAARYVSGSESEEATTLVAIGVSMEADQRYLLTLLNLGAHPIFNRSTMVNSSKRSIVSLALFFARSVIILSTHPHTHTDLSVKKNTGGVSRLVHQAYSRQDILLHKNTVNSARVPSRNPPDSQPVLLRGASVQDL